MIRWRRARAWVAGQDWRTWVFRTWIVAFTAATVWATAAAWGAVHDLRDLVRAEAAEDVVEDAEACLDSWDRHFGARHAVGASMTGIVDLLRAVFPNANPDTVDRTVARLPVAISTAQEELVAPECDRGDAVREIGQAP